MNVTRIFRLPRRNGRRITGPMALTSDDVRRIARLARIAVPEEELAGLSGELSGILAWIEQLEAVDVATVEPMTSAVALALPMREDAVSEGGSPEQVLANAPQAVGGFFAVPKVVE
jgi:aspartyl-tRNA(Asn)/glutamyl-tRNA(Gln) amidotransferase subunit C